MEMISLSLFGHPFAECFSMTRAMRLSSTMRDSACLAYIQEGVQVVYAPTQKLVARENESILMKCGNYVANINDATPEKQFKSVVFHMEPATIKKVFGDRDISFLKARSRKTKAA